MQGNAVNGIIPVPKVLLALVSKGSKQRCNLKVGNSLGMKVNF